MFFLNHIIMFNPKDYLIEILEFYIKKLQSDSCTMKEINSATHTLESNMKVYGSISDFADFYHKPETSIRVNIFRKLLDKPIRKVLYPFHKIHRIVPDNWHNKNDLRI